MNSSSVIGIIHPDIDTDNITQQNGTLKETCQNHNTGFPMQIHTEGRLGLNNFDDGTEETEKILNYKYLLL
jgi:hypothetical protein